MDGFRTVRQYVFDLPSLNLFECPRLDRLLSEIDGGGVFDRGASRWSGRSADGGAGDAGARRLHKVAMVSDCIGMWDPHDGIWQLRQVESKNVEWLTAGGSGGGGLVRRGSGGWATGRGIRDGPRRGMCRRRRGGWGRGRGRFGCEGKGTRKFTTELRS